MSDTSPQPLNIAIVGAGIVGLTAATALRQQGHNVEIFESAAFSKEIGAGLQVPPNARRVVDHLGFKPENARAIIIKGLLIHPASKVSPPVFRFESEDPDAISYSVHRADFHDELRRLATSPDLPNKPVKLHLSRHVKSCNPENGTIEFDDGQILKADLIVGCDGLRSVVRTAVVGHEIHAIGWNPPRAIYRWLVPSSVLDTEPNMQWFKDEPFSRGHSIVGPKEDAVIFYLCRNGELINCVGIHTDKRPESVRASRETGATLEEMEEMYPHFAKEYKALFKNAQELKHWPLLQLPSLPRWNRGRACILGDAAHAMFPFSGQGAAMGIEDAASLGILLPLGTKIEDLPARLAAHQHLRKARAEMVAAFSSRQQFTETPEGVQHRIKGEDRLTMSTYNVLEVAREYFQEHFANAQKS